jgi:plasmid stabilization system protein ParE
LRAVVWSSRASRQYLDALQFLAERNEPAAAKLAERIRDTVHALAIRPIGRPGHASGTFEKVVLKTSYLLVYELSGDEIRVLRLFHTSQDWHNAERES